MAVTLRFDSQQKFQLDAVKAATDLFVGLPLLDDFSQTVLAPKTAVASQLFSEDILAYGNNTFLNDEVVLENLKKIQEQNYIVPDEHLQQTYNYNNFSVEMETGTGKTYVYLRTIHELHALYGYTKFVIVVPGRAIRAGTLQNMEVTEDHFRKLYNNTPFSFFLYDSKNMSPVRDFAMSRQLSIMLINIEAFAQDFQGEDYDLDSGVLFHRQSEKLSGKTPREFVQSVHPIVIIDEPQSVDTTPIRKRAISLLNPLFTLRYSATHKNRFNLLYRLDPVAAYAQRLVKKIAVADVQGGENTTLPYIKLIDITHTPRLRATLELNVNTPNGARRKRKIVEQHERKGDLFEITGGRDEYRGYQVSEISLRDGSGHIEFSLQGLTLSIGQEVGGDVEAIKRVQIRKTIQEHFDKELSLQGKGVKVLSLFFLDHVANYREYPEEGEPQKGKYAVWFEEEYESLRQHPRYVSLQHPPVDKVHDGYFAQDKEGGNFKDSSGEGSTKADATAYEKIMQGREQLLSLDEPLKFIFTHSALKEGWDNPNVFQICTLTTTNDVMKKRQQIGRGMRLPVNQEGERIFDEAINRLVVVVNESYKDFADKLQKEYQDDCGITFGLFFEKDLAGRTVDKDGLPYVITSEDAKKIISGLKDQGILDATNKITERFQPYTLLFSLNLMPEYTFLELPLIDLLASYYIESHVEKHEPSFEVRPNNQVVLSDDFKDLWHRISGKTFYELSFVTSELIEKAVLEVLKMPSIVQPKLRYIVADFTIDGRGVTHVEATNRDENINIENTKLPDVVSQIQKRVNLKRKTIIDVLLASRRLTDFKINPQQFIDLVSSAIKKAHDELVVAGITYKPYDEAITPEIAAFTARLRDLVASDKTIHSHISVDSGVERRFATDLNNKQYVKLFIKLPRWFVVDTPVGGYIPDWAILKENDEKIYLVRETKGSLQHDDLRALEERKIECGRKHFEAIGINDFEVVMDASSI